MALQYKIVTMSVGWDDTYNNTLHFDTREKQYEYFNIPTVFDNAVEVNFPVGSLVNATVTYRGVDDIQQLMNDNYCIIQNNASSLETPQYYFYFIKQTNYLSSNQVTLSLELDVIQTYIIDTTFSDCLVERCMVDRFISDGVDFKFNNGKDSILLNSEGLDLPKYLSNSETVVYNYDNASASQYISEIQWGYVYIHTYNLGIIDDLKTGLIDSEGNINYYKTIIKTNMGGVNLPYTILVAPVNSSKIKINGEDGLEYTDYSLDLLLQNIDEMGLTPYIYNVKISHIPPFSSSGLITESSVTKDDNGIYELYYNELYSNQGYINNIAYATNGKSLTLLSVIPLDGYVRTLILTTSSRSKADPYINGGYEWDLELKPYGTVEYKIYGYVRESMFSMFYLINQNEVLDFSIELEKNMFTKEEIISGSYYDLEPKALSSNVKELRIRESTGQSFSFDMQKINADTATFEINESLTADINRGIIYLAETDNDSVLSKSKYGLLGLTYAVDLSIPYYESQIDSFMANNKNFHAIAKAQDITNIVNTLTQSIGAGLAAPAATTAAVAGNTAISGIASNLNSMYKRGLTLDNMEAAPGSLHNLDGNAFLSILSNSNGAKIYADKYVAVEQDTKKFIDYLHEYGYSYALIDQPKNWLNKREHFSYVQATLESITSDKKLSNQVRDKFRNIFAKGIKFWNTDDFDLTTNNIEWSVING